MIYKSFIDKIKSTTKTFFFFTLFCFFLPAFVISYLIVSTARKCWLCLLSNRYPYLEFSKTHNVRSLVDTSRNPGIFHVLLQVEGECNLEAFKAKFQDHVLNRRDKSGRISFPKMKLTLVSCWGQYAFIKNADHFNINHQIILGQTNYRGRPITEQNIQDYISDIISKYIPPDIPPWQIIIIPTISQSHQASASSAECDSAQSYYYYVLLRMHHLLMEEEPNLNISDILMVDSSNSQSRMIPDFRKIKSPFMNLMEKPYYIPKLCNCIKSGMINKWNEFIYHHDPLESPDIERKHSAGLSQLFSVILICFVTVCHDFWKGFNATQNNPLIKIKFLKTIIDRETKRRNLNLAIVWKAIKTTFNPINVLKSTFVCIWGFVWKMITFIPCFFYYELQSLRTCLLLGQCLYPSTISGFLFEYVPILLGAFEEFLKFSKLVFTAPKLIYEELFEDNGKLNHYLQNVSLCGRKVVSWSDKIEKEEISKKSKQGINDIDILLAATSLSFKQFFNDIPDEIVPDKLQISARCITEEHLFGKVNYISGTSGLVSLKLPIFCLSTNAIAEIQESIKAVKDQQIVINLITIAQVHFDFMTKALPDVFMKLLINFLSRRYAVSLNEITEAIPRMESYKTLLGQEIVDAIYFRPPQANTAISITIQRFKSHIRLAVIADSQITPKHTTITNCWKNQLENMKFQMKM